MSPCVWFESQAEEAAKFYVSTFKNSKILNTARYDKESAKVSGRPEGSVLTVTFNLDGNEFMALNGGPVFKLTPAISFIMYCETQSEIDKLWNTLSSNGGKPGQCGWVEDKFGVSWQIVPTMLGKLMGQGDSKKTQRMMGALMQMNKLDIAALQNAYDGKA